MKRSELVKAAKELNEVLGLEPQINVREKPKRLVELIREAAELVDPELDDLSDDTLSVIDKLIEERQVEKGTGEREEVSEKVVEEKEKFKELQEVGNAVKKKKKVSKRGKSSEIREYVLSIFSKKSGRARSNEDIVKEVNERFGCSLSPRSIHGYRIALKKKGLFND